MCKWLCLTGVVCWRCTHFMIIITMAHRLHGRSSYTLHNKCLCCKGNCGQSEYTCMYTDQIVSTYWVSSAQCIPNSQYNTLLHCTE